MPPEKIRRKRWLRRRAVIFSSPFRTTNIAKRVHFSHILAEIHQSLYPVQTSWRRERDSNPRYPFEYSGFQDVPSNAALTCLQPVTCGVGKWQSGILALIRHLLCSGLCSDVGYRLRTRKSKPARTFRDPHLTGGYTTDCPRLGFRVPIRRTQRGICTYAPSFQDS